MQPRLHGLLADVEDGGGLGRAHLLDLAQYEDGAERVGQRRDRGLEHVAQLVVGHLLLGGGPADPRRYDHLRSPIHRGPTQWSGLHGKGSREPTAPSTLYWMGGNP